MALRLAALGEARRRKEVVALLPRKPRDFWNSGLQWDSRRLNGEKEGLTMMRKLLVLTVLTLFVT